MSMLMWRIGLGLNQVMTGSHRANGREENRATTYSRNESPPTAADRKRAIARVRQELGKHGQTMTTALLMYGIALLLFGFASLTRVPLPVAVSVLLALLWTAAAGAAVVDVCFLRQATMGLRPPHRLDAMEPKDACQGVNTSTLADTARYAQTTMMMVSSAWAVNLAELVMLVVFGTGGRDAVQCANACCLTAVLPLVFYWILSFHAASRDLGAQK